MPEGVVFAHPSLVRQRFREVASLPEPLLDLVEASLLIAQEDLPGLQIERYLQSVEQWSRAVNERIGGSNDIERVIDSVNRLLYEEEGFHGENEDYYDPRSALINDLFETHGGLPITLSILYIELSRRAGVVVSGIAIPGRFLVKFTGQFGELVIDPFDGGRVLGTSELQLLLDRLYSGGVRLREHHLRSFGRHEILSRELAQLKAAYLSRHDIPHAAATSERLLILDDRDPYELRDRAALAMQMHAYGVAIEALERFLTLSPSAEDAARVRHQIIYLRAWMEQN